MLDVAEHLQAMVYRKASEVPPIAWAALRSREVDANTILPILDKCMRQEEEGRIVQGHYWVVVVAKTPDYALKLILSCTDGLSGKYPLFLFSPTSYTIMKTDRYTYPALDVAARCLQTVVPTQRIFSVFGRDLLSRTFATIWARLTNIAFIPDPYYDSKISYLTRASLEHKRRELPPIPNAQIRPAGAKDLPNVARLCQEFAATSPPFTLTDEGATFEAQKLIGKGLVWVLTLESHGVVSLVAFTRNSAGVATLTKVYTKPKHRGGRLAERLVRAVCHYLLYDCSKDRVALFVGKDNPAAILYDRVGFLGVGKDAAPVEGIDIWCEMGFDPSRVQLGHW